jgi:ATP-dependent exoDNAse (exonuclease V) alpha subunit
LILTEAQSIELARDFVQSEFVDHGMVADLNVHWDIGEDGMPKPHAHVMLTMRAAIVDGDEIGFGRNGGFAIVTPMDSQLLAGMTADTEG